MVEGQQDTSSLDGSRRDGWGIALTKSLLVLVLSFASFVILPDRLFSYLALHVSPRARDGLVLLWVAIAFALLTWLFLRLQARGTMA
jgi:hypothetical protein